MAATLAEILLAPDTQPKVIADCYLLIEQEVSDKSGVSGAAVKLAYKAVNTFRPGHIRHMVEVLLPQMVDKLDPYWADFTTSGGSEFGDYLAKRGDEVAQALLSVSDAKAASSGRPTQRSQACRGRAPARRRPGAEVRGLTTSRSPTRRRSERGHDAVTGTLRFTGSTGLGLVTCERRGWPGGARRRRR